MESLSRNPAPSSSCEPFCAGGTSRQDSAVHTGTELEREPGTCLIHTQVLFSLVDARGSSLPVHPLCNPICIPFSSSGSGCYHGNYVHSCVSLASGKTPFSLSPFPPWARSCGCQGVGKPVRILVTSRKAAVRRKNRELQQGLKGLEEVIVLVWPGARSLVWH